MSDGFEMDEMKEIIDSFVVEVAEHIENLDQNLVELEDNAEDYDLLNQIFRAAHTIKGAASFLDFNLMAKVTHHAESVLDALRKGKMKVTSEIMDVILEAIDVIKEIFEEIRQQYKENENRDLSGIIAKLEGVLNQKTSVPQNDKTEKIKEDKKEENVVSSAPPSNKVETIKEQKKVTEEEKNEPESKKEIKKTTPNVTKKSSEDAVQTIRVDLKRLDNVMNLVQELVPGRNRLVQISKVFKTKLMESQKQLEDAFMNQSKQEISNDDNQIQKKAKKKFNDDILDLTEIYDEVTSQIDLITTELQSAVMKTRMLPISNVFNKFPRMVRDLAREEKKNIRLEMEGKETELDKSVIEIIGDPLMHCIRNSVDHGIELPSEREEKGKSPEGNIVLTAYHEGNYIVVKVIDDGKGMDADILRQKAIEKGIYSEEEAGNMSDKDILTVIFQPGFSTAKQVTNVSGRGVGMDVLKSNIEKLNGIIDVESTLGEGSTVTIKIPLTLAIIQALLVRVFDNIHDEIYAIPLSSVIETVRIHKNEIKTIKDNQVYRLRNTVLPLLSLSQVFDLDVKHDTQDHIYVVVLGLAEKRLGLMVNGLLGQEEVVVKSIGDFFDDTPGIAGATIMGDGRVRLIVNVSDLIDLGHRV